MRGTRHSGDNEAGLPVPADDVPVDKRSRRGEDADWIGERLLELDACECEADFYAWAAETGLEDVYNHFEWGWGGYLRGLCKTLLPELKRMLREEEAERQIAGARPEELHEAIQSIYTR